MSTLEILFAPAEFKDLEHRDLSATTCVVFDVLRATSTMVTALWNGAAAIIPVAEIDEALEIRRRQPDVLLGGERDGVRIGPDLAGGVTFDFGNSPREFTGPAVRGRTLVMTTTNGTRALRACAKAKATMACSFLNLGATADAILRLNPSELLLVCSGTLDQAAYEDVLGAGALCDLLWQRFQEGRVADSVVMARELFQKSKGNLEQALSRSRNGKRLLSKPALRDDVAFCCRRDTFPLTAFLGTDGIVRRGDVSSPQPSVRKPASDKGRRRP